MESRIQVPVKKSGIQNSWNGIKNPRLSWGAFLWYDPDQDQWSEIIWIMVDQMNRSILVQSGFISSFYLPWSLILIRIIPKERTLGFPCMGRSVRGCFHNLIQNLYSNSSCTLKIVRSQARSFHYLRGVRQGYILSPLLFNLYINDLPYAFQNKWYQILFSFIRWWQLFHPDLK